MLFNSKEFILVFLPIVFLGYYFLPKVFKNFSNIIWLLFSSLIFYSYWNYKFVLLIIFSAIVNYLIGNNLKKFKNTYLLIFGVVFNLFVLGYFKYKNFFIENINFLFDQNIPLTNLILPLGISFFTFQQIAYLVDMKNHLNTTKDSFIKYFLFVSFFPQLIAGPIVKHKNILNQLNSKRIFKLNYKNIAIGLSIFCIGLFKKTFIADNLALIADPIFLASENLVKVSFFEGWTATIAYSLQIYFDFSAYSEMAIGLALLFNIKLPFNFTSPYKSKNIVIFWRNWNITLSSFFRDYLFFPIKYFFLRFFYNKNFFLFKTELLSSYFPILFTFGAIGIWHGAGWNFVIFGLLHGLGIIYVEILSKIKCFQKINFKFLSIIFTFLFVSLCLVLFRLESLSGAMNLYNSLIGINGISFSTRFDFLSIFFNNLKFISFDSFFPNSLISKSTSEVALILIISSFVCFCMQNVKEIFYQKRKIGKIIIRWMPNFYWMMFCVILFIVGFLYINNTIQFIYFAF